MLLNEFLSSLDKVSQRGDQYTACCPAHDDKKPSLAITEKDHKILLKCWSGCTTQGIVGSMGLHLKDLFTDSGMNLQQRKQYATKKSKNQLRQLLCFELHMLYQIQTSRITSNELARDSKFMKVRPEYVAMPDGELERELLAVKRIREALNDLYR